MMPAIPQSPLDDALCIWLDEAIPVLETIDFLRWPGEKDISLAEALRATLFYCIKRAIAQGETGNAARRKAIRFPSSVVSRVQNAIAHLNSRHVAETIRPRSVVFVPMTVPQLANQIPVAHALKEIERSYCFFFKSNKWAEQIDLEGLDVAKQSQTLQCKILSARLRARVMWLRLGKEENVALPKLHFGGQQVDLGKVVLETLAFSISSVFEAYESAKYILDYVTPKLIAVGNDLVPFGRVMVACAKRQQIKSVCLINQAHEGPLDAYRLADRFVVFGNYSKRVLCAAGIDEKKIKACGSAYLDALVTRKTLPFLTIESQKKGGLVVSDYSRAWLPKIARIAERLPHHFILVLASDVQQLRHAQRVAAKHPNMRAQLRGELSGGEHAACMKSASHILCTSFATLMDAIGLGKQVIVLATPEWGDPEFLNALLVPVASDESVLAQMLLSANFELELSTDTSRKFIEDYFFRRDGNASSRIAQAILST